MFPNGGGRMEIVVEKDTKNPLLNRREIYIRVKYQDEATPSRNAVREKICGLFNADPSKVVVSYIKPQFGMGEALSYVKIYDTEEDLQKIEPKHIIARNFQQSEEEETEE
jgi:small subunit ribosomal protein S24e